LPRIQPDQLCGQIEIATDDRKIVDLDQSSAVDDSNGFLSVGVIVGVGVGVGVHDGDVFLNSRPVVLVTAV
jgi:hypothetical protein